MFSHLQELYRSERGEVARNPMNMRLGAPNGAQRRLSGKALKISAPLSVTAITALVAAFNPDYRRWQ